MDGDPDADLVRLVAAGDQAAMRAMVAKKLPRLIALGMRLLNDRAEAEDVAQDTFIRIWSKVAGWQPGRARFDTWIHKVALNLCRDRLRGRREVSAGEFPELADGGPGPDARLVKEDPGRRVRQALAAIAPRQREAIVLVYYQGLSNIEAADALKISVDALESLLARGRRSLRKLLEKDGFHG